MADDAGVRPGFAGAGSGIAVATVGTLRFVGDGLLAHRERLERLVDGLAGQRSAAARVAGWADWSAVPAAPAAARVADRELDRAVALLGRAVADAASIAAALRTSQALAERAESLIRAGLRAQAQVAAWALGSVAPLLALLILTSPSGLAALLANGAGLRAAGASGRLQQWLLDHPEIVTSPGFVEFVRLAALSQDGAVDGVTGLPLPLVPLADAAREHDGLDVGGAGLIAAGGVLGVLLGSGVAITRTEATRGVLPPAGSRQRLERVPEGGSVRIETYQAPGAPRRVVVYVGPTETFSIRPTGAAEDMRSNIELVSGGDAAALRAARLAMREAGVTASDEVQFVGFSQGGIVAARLASSGDWNTAGLQTFGAPTGTFDLPGGIDGMLVRHTDDLVPALGGYQSDTDLVQVERRAFLPDDEIPKVAAPAHQKDAYLVTASAIDDARSDAVRDQNARLDAFAAEVATRPGATATSVTYHLDRVWQAAR